ncbi:ABC transporter, ATP-binding protein [Hyalangium minutum]|uniref:ABC transporter, ATP-binding protein n=1 Tax=Hyalangium minutum TaxID=394096 RepID=A0A085WMT6_9BACT|nr:ABC transporter, ATP-binding protein [Hyalangium minutum]
MEASLNGGSCIVIEARDLSKNVQGGTSVRNVRFTVSRGEVVGIIGPRGAGKSTLLKMLAGFVTPSSGEGVVAGLSTLMDPFRIKNRVGYAAGDCNLPTRPTPRELLKQRGQLHGVPPLELEARIEAVVNAFELERFVDLPVATLQPDQQQRLNLARALLHDPPALILDEPTHSLDLMGSHFVLMSIRAARDAGKAVLLATRSLSDAEFLCDRVLLMHAGAIVDQGTISEVCAHTGARTFTEAVMRQFPLRTTA